MELKKVFFISIVNLQNKHNIYANYAGTLKNENNCVKKVTFLSKNNSSFKEIPVVQVKKLCKLQPLRVSVCVCVCVYICVYVYMYVCLT